MRSPLSYSKAEVEHCTNYFSCRHDRKHDIKNSRGERFVLFTVSEAWAIMGKETRKNSVLFSFSVKS